MSDIKTEVRQYILDNFLMGGDPGRITENTSFIGKGIIDSTGVLELVAFLERTYNIHVEDMEMIPDNLDTLVNIERFVTSKVS